MVLLTSIRNYDAVKHTDGAIPLDCAGLLDALNNVPKGQFMTIVSDTIPKMRKGGNPYYGHIVKRSITQSTASPDFKTAMNNRRAKDGEAPREVKARKWGRRIKGTPFVAHIKKGESFVRLYLEMYVIRSVGYVYIDTRTGAEVPHDVINAFLPPRSDSEIIWRDYYVGGIVALNANGKRYTIADNFKLTADLAARADAALGR